MIEKINKEKRKEKKKQKEQIKLVPNYYYLVCKLCKTLAPSI